MCDMGGSTHTTISRVFIFPISTNKLYLTNDLPRVTTH